MSPGTKATSVGFKRRESGVETVLLAFHFEEQRLIGFLSDFLKCWILFEKPSYLVARESYWLLPAFKLSHRQPIKRV